MVTPESPETRIGSKLRRLGQILSPGSEAYQKLPEEHRKAIETIVKKRGHSDEDIRAGALDNEIKKRFARHLAAEFNASAKIIEQHADHKWRRALSVIQTSVGYIGGTAAAAGLIAAAPKLSLLIGAGAEGFTSQALGMPKVASYLPLAVGAGFLAIPMISMYATRRLTHIPRKGREAGNILRHTMKDPAELERLREVVINGENIYAEFDRIYQDQKTSWKTRAAWLAMMMGASVITGGWGAGAIKEYQDVMEWVRSPQGMAEMMRNPAEHGRNLLEKMTTIPGKALGTGVTELSGFVTDLWTKATGVVSGTWPSAPQVPRVR